MGIVLGQNMGIFLGGAAAPPDPWTNEYSLEFDGTSCLTVTDFDTLDAGNVGSPYQYTISFWTKVTTIGTNQYFYRANDNLGNATHYAYVRTTGSVQAFVGGSNSNWTRSNELLVGGQWHNIIITLDQTTGNRYTMLKIYVDGVENTSSNYFGNLPNDSEDLDIGCNQGTIHLTGNMDEFAVWPGYVFDQSQVDEVHNSGTPNNLDNLSNVISPTIWLRMGD